MTPVEPLQDVQNSKYKVGQVWRYHTRSQEPSSTFTVVKVELQHGQEIVIHVHVQGLQFSLPGVVNGQGKEIAHMPFSEAALDASVTERLGVVTALPAFEKGYEVWRSAFLDVNAGVFSVTVSEAIAFTEQSFN